MGRTPEMIRHDNFVGRVDGFISKFDGWELIGTGIEHNPDLRKKTAGDDTPASQFLRTSADILVRNRGLGASFALEAKVPYTRKWPNVSVEFLPLHCHWKLADVTECVYVAEGHTCNGDLSIGFHAADAPKLFDTIFIPEFITRFDPVNDVYRSVHRSQTSMLAAGHEPAPDVPGFYTYLIDQWPDPQELQKRRVNVRGKVSGSGDVYCLMGPRAYNTLKPWKEVITEKIETKAADAKARGVK